MGTTPVSFRSGELILEGELCLPDSERPIPLVVLCHAHPLYGGSMDSNVLDAIGASLNGAAIAAFKFNFRGVGRSRGVFGGGTGEQHDLGAALGFVTTREEIDIARIGVAGYSFGAAVAFNVARRDGRVRSLALVSPAISAEESVAARDVSLPVLVVAGGRDTLVPAARLAGLGQPAGGQIEVAIIPGADHFWWGHEEVLARTVAAFFKQRLLTGGANSGAEKSGQ